MMLQDKTEQDRTRQDKTKDYYDNFRDTIDKYH